MTVTADCLRTPAPNLRTAEFLAHASDQAYAPDPVAWAHREGLSQVSIFNRGNVQGYWARAENLALLVFRGTSNLGQWVRDARILPASHPWGSVHVGFRNGLGEVETHLREFSAAATSVGHVWIAGHSLGGALALLAAASLKDQGITSHVCTYGQPRVGLGEFARRFDHELPGRLIRFVNQNDIVPRLPPGLIYRHAGLVKRIVRPGVLESARGLTATADHPPELDDAELPAATEAEAEAFIRVFESQPETILEGGLQVEGRIGSLFKDHSIGEYIRLLTEIRNQVPPQAAGV